MTPWVGRLIIANVVIHLVMSALPGARPFALQHFALTPRELLMEPWTLITYMFLHGRGFAHIFFNMLGLYFFGPRLEVRLGSRQFLALYAVSGLVASLLSIGFSFNATVVGASGAVYGVLLGFARYWPNERIIIFPLPVPIRARVLVIILAVVSLWLGVSASAQGIAHFAHLGGFLGGYLFLTFRERRSPAARFRALAQPAPRSSGPIANDVARWNQIDRGQLHPLNREEFDRLLTKIRELGAASLTSSERAFLERFSGS